MPAVAMTVVFSITSGPGTLTPPITVIASAGIAKVVYRSGTSAGTATIQATSTGLTADTVNITLLTNVAPSAPQDLRCNGSINPAGITDATPDLSWTFTDSDTSNGDIQSAYRLLL